MFKINKFEVVKTIIAILIALAITIAIIFMVSDEPLTAIYYFAISPLTSVSRFGSVLEIMTPLIFTGLAIAIVFEAKEFNIAIPGYFYIGGVAAVPIAIYTNTVFLSPFSAIIFGGVVGAVFAFITGFLKIKWRVSELVTSLMMNYILFLLGIFIVKNYFRDPNQGSVFSYLFSDGARIPKIESIGIHYGLFIALFFIVVAWIFMYRSRMGYEIRIVGSNPNFAKYSGMNVSFVVMGAHVISGFLAGIGGAVEMISVYTRYRWTDLPYFGFDGILVAILARNNPVFILFASFFMAYIRTGTDIMSRNSDVKSEMVSIVLSVMITFVAATEFLPKLRQYFVLKDLEKQRVNQ